MKEKEHFADVIRLYSDPEMGPMFRILIGIMDLHGLALDLIDRGEVSIGREHNQRARDAFEGFMEIFRCGGEEKVNRDVLRIIANLEESFAEWV